jgi:uncharacterized protein
MGGCMRCGRCCTSFGVCVTPFDILRLSRATGKPPQELVKAIDEPPERERAEPAVIIDGRRCLIVLRWKGQKGRKCMFYSNSGCATYGSRPMLCRTYPFCMKDGKLAGVESRACPAAWSPGDEAQYKADVAAYEKEVAAYAIIAGEWNRGRGGGLQGFLAFALPSAAALAG